MDLSRKMTITEARNLTPEQKKERKKIQSKRAEDKRKNCPIRKEYKKNLRKQPHTVKTPQNCILD
jgi:hypothetical protein